MKKIFLFFILLFNLVFASELEFKTAIQQLYNNKSLLSVSDKKIKKLTDIKIGRLKMYYNVVYLPIEYYVNEFVLGDNSIISENLKYIAKWKKNNWELLQSIYKILENQIEFLTYLYLNKNQAENYMYKFKKQEENELNLIKNILTNVQIAMKNKNLKGIYNYLKLFNETYYLKSYIYKYGKLNYISNASRFSNYLFNEVCKHNMKCLDNIGDYYDNGKVLKGYFLNSYKCFTKHLIIPKKGKVHCLIRFTNFYLSRYFYFYQLGEHGKVLKKLSSTNDLLNVYQIKGKGIVIPSSLVLLKLYKKRKKFLTTKQKIKLYNIFLQIINSENNYFYIIGKNMRNPSLEKIYNFKRTVDKKFKNLFFR